MTRIPNPTGTRVAAPAKTYPPRFPRLRFFAHGNKPTAEEWERMQAHFREHPEDRIRRGEQHMEGENRFFICYSRSHPGGERWGTKEELAEARIRSAAAVRRSRRKRMKSDPAFREAQLARLASIVERQRAVDEEKREARERKRQARRKAARSIRRKKGVKTREK